MSLAVSKNAANLILNKLDVRTLAEFPGFVAIKNVMSKYEWMSDATLSLVGCRKLGEILGKMDNDLKCPASKLASEFIKQDQRVIASRLEHRYFSFVHYQKSEPTVSIGVKKPIFDHLKNVIGIFISMHEIYDAHLIQLGKCLSSVPFPNRNQRLMYSYEFNDTFQGKVNLSERQLEVLFFIIRGRTSKEIAHYLQLSHRTVEQYTDHLKDKFNCLNKSSLIERVIYEGYWAVLPKRLVNVHARDIIKVHLAT